jgi:ParB family transcriptional regulator, chromosome partitioning protein
MSVKKRALGRGLDSLIAPLPEEPGADDHRRIMEIPVEAIHPNINQPRSRFSEDRIAELADSIREKGILQPLLVRRRGEEYELVAGERRFRAAKLVGMQTLPCLAIEVSDEGSFEMALIENLQREDLNPIEEARAYLSLVQQFDLSQDEVASRVGKNRSTVANSLRLMNLPLDIQEDILEARLTAGHARAILQIDDLPKKRQLRNIIVAKGLSVREAEARARQMGSPKKRKPPKPGTIQVQMRSLQEEMSMKIGLPVFIKAITAQSGKVEIQYHSLDDFELITDFFGVEKQ